MANATPQQPPASVILALVVTGFGIGWLAGLSVSPVVSIVITTLTGTVATILAALSGVKEEFLDVETSPNTLRRLLRWVTPVPLAWLVAGLVIGASTGLWARTHNWLSPDPPAPPPVVLLKDEIQQWVDLGIAQDEVVRSYFQSRFTSIQPTAPTVPFNPTPTFRDSILYATASPEECVIWTGLIEKERYADLVTEIRSSAVKPFRQLPEIITDTVQLAAIVGEVLCTDMQ